MQNVVTGVAPNTASAYIDFTPSIYNLSILDAANNKLADVGDGGGAGTGTKKYEDARLYTVVVTGTAGSLIPEQGFRTKALCRLKSFLFSSFEPFWSRFLNLGNCLFGFEE